MPRDAYGPSDSIDERSKIQTNIRSLDPSSNAQENTWISVMIPIEDKGSLTGEGMVIDMSNRPIP